MISELILKKPLKNTKKHSRGTVISLVGVESGVGTTHFALLFGHYLVRQRYRIALVECNHSGDFGRIEAAYEGGKKASNRTKFKAKGVVYYKEVSSKELTQIYQEPYDVIILDIGSHLKEFREEILRADQTMFIGFYGDWRAWRYKEFLQNHSDLIRKRSKLLVSFGSNEELRSLKKLSSSQCYGIPCIEDPFIRSKEGNRFLNNISGEM